MADFFFNGGPQGRPSVHAEAQLFLFWAKMLTRGLVGGWAEDTWKLSGIFCVECVKIWVWVGQKSQPGGGEAGTQKCLGRAPTPGIITLPKGVAYRINFSSNPSVFLFNNII